MRNYKKMKSLDAKKERQIHDDITAILTRGGATRWTGMNVSTQPFWDRFTNSSKLDEKSLGAGLVFVNSGIFTRFPSFTSH